VFRTLTDGLDGRVTLRQNRALSSQPGVRRNGAAQTFQAAIVAALAEKVVCVALPIPSASKFSNPIVYVAQEKWISWRSWLCPFHQFPIVPLAASLTRGSFRQTL
jgi:hypothetical protein